MKKLLALGAIAVAAPLFAAVESPNIVGYQTSDLTSSVGSLITSGVMFQNTTGSSIDIQSIQMGASVYADAGSYIMWWEGHWEKAYWVELQDVDGTPKGWGDDENWETINKTFELGEAFFVFGSSDNAAPSITVSGQVYNPGTQYAGVSLAPGSLEFVSPVFPLGEISIQSIKMADAVYADAGSYIMWWEGHWEKAYWVELQDVDGTPKGWGDDENWETINKTLGSGEGFFAFGSSDNAAPEILFPNPLYVAE